MGKLSTTKCARAGLEHCILKFYKVYPEILLLSRYESQNDCVDMKNETFFDCVYIHYFNKDVGVE